MAITAATIQDNGYDADGGITSTTASVTLTAGRMYFLHVFSNDWSGATTTPTCSGWTQYETYGTANYRLTSFYKVGDGSTGTHTISFGAQSQTRTFWIIDEMQGTDLTASVLVQTDNNQASGGVTLSAALAAFTDAINNGAYLVGVHKTNTGMTAEAGGVWAEVSGQTPYFSMYTFFRLGEDTTPTATVAATDWWYTTAAEIAQAAAGGLSIPRGFNRGVNRGFNSGMIV